MPTPVFILLCIAGFFLLPLVMYMFLAIFEELSRLYEEFDKSKDFGNFAELSFYISMVISFMAWIVWIIYKFLL
jgi:hypothetical protein